MTANEASKRLSNHSAFVVVLRLGGVCEKQVPEQYFER
jgi:hypothetical protein